MNKFAKDEKIINKEIETMVTARNSKVIVIKVVVILLIFYIVFGYTFGFTRMKDNSMLPYIAEGDLLLFYRIEKEYAIGDVVVFSLDKEQYVLRIVAGPGQVVKFSEDGKLLIDGYPEGRQSFFNTIQDDDTEVIFPYRVEKGCYFVVGDYRTETNDSRKFGAISSEKIEGKVISLLKTKNI